MINFSLRSIPAAAAMTAVLVFGAQAQAQTTANPPTNAQGGAAIIPKGPDSTPKSAEQRDMKKPMAKEGDKAGMSNKGGAANMPKGPDSKAMADQGKAKGSTSSMGQTTQPPTNAAGGASNPPKGPNTSAKDAAGTGTSSGSGMGTTK